MKATELLEILREDWLDDALGSDDEGERQWKDSTLLRHLNKAQEEAVNRGLLLRDSATPRICEIILVGGQAEYALDKRILQVDKVNIEWPDGTLRTLVPLNRGEMETAFTSEWETLEGMPAAYYPEGHKIRVAHVPSAEYAGMKLKLDVYRLPLAQMLAGFSAKLAAPASAGDTAITLRPGHGLTTLSSGMEWHLQDSNGNAIIATAKAGDVLTCLPLSAALDAGAVVTADNEPEIPFDQHLHLIHWVVANCYLKRDADLKDKGKGAADHMVLFAQYFGPPVDHAKRMHRLHSTGSIRFSGMQTPSFKGRVGGMAMVI